MARDPGATGTEQRFSLDAMALVRDALLDPDGNLAGLRKRGFTEAEHFKAAIFYVDRAIEATLADAVTPRTADAEVEQRLAACRAHAMGLVRRMLVGHLLRAVP